MSEPYVGEIRAFGFHFAPVDWAYCNGQLLSIAQNSALFAILGTAYGGNGQTTFALPNMQNVAPMHWGNGAGLSSYVIGEPSGTLNVTLNASQMPQHNHTIQTAQGNPNVPTQFVPLPDGTTWMGNSNPGAAYLSSGSISSSFSPKAIGVAGGSQPHSNSQPLLAVNFCIALYGVFPTRN